MRSKKKLILKIAGLILSLLLLIQSTQIMSMDFQKFTFYAILFILPTLYVIIDIFHKRKVNKKDFLINFILISMFSITIWIYVFSDTNVYCCPFDCPYFFVWEFELSQLLISTAILLIMTLIQHCICNCTLQS